jgi:GNAT superfamily N-acetyltransferase
MFIRAATPTDAVAIARVHVDSWRTTYTGIVPADYLANLSHAQREQFWSNILSTPAPSGCVYVAEHDTGEIVGFASGGPERSGDTLYQGELYAIYLLARYQRQGLGRHLTMAVVQCLLQCGLPSMLIWVLAANPGRAFYAALGGQPVYEKNVTIGAAQLLEVAYGWPDLRDVVQRLQAACPACTSCYPVHQELPTDSAS